MRRWMTGSEGPVRSTEMTATTQPPIVDMHPAREPRVRLNGVCPYYTMFPLDFPLRALADARPGERVLDPFCGRGTTLFAARLLGLEAVGIDVNPVAAAIAEAKLRTSGARSVTARAVRLIRDNAGASKPEGDFWDLAFHTETLGQLSALRAGLAETRNDAAAIVLRALTLGVLHGPLRKGTPAYFSNQMPRTYDAAVRYWRERGLRPPKVDVVDLLQKRAAYLLASLPPGGTGRVICGDARRKLQGMRGPFARIVTSPPYLGMRTYLPDQWLRGWFLGGPPEPQYTLVGSIGTEDADAFANALGETWRAVAKASVTGARLFVRFGSLPSVARDPLKLLMSSIDRAICGWQFVGAVETPVPPRRSRQASQFGFSLASAQIEVDAEFVLSGR